MTKKTMDIGEITRILNARVKPENWQWVTDQAALHGLSLARFMDQWIEAERCSAQGTPKKTRARRKK